MRHNTPPTVEMEGADDDPTTHGWTEIEVIDPLDPYLDPIIVRTSQDFESSDDDNDLISDILPAAEKSIEEDVYSDTADQQDDLQSQRDTVPTQAESHVRSVLEPVVTDLPGKRPRDDPSA
jgi:hypothetical protein